MCLNEQLSYTTLRDRTYQIKRIKHTHVVPITFAMLQTRLGKEKWRNIKVLLDSGASATVVSSSLVKKLRQKTDARTDWNTAAGTFSTTATVKLDMKLPELSPSATIELGAHVHKGDLANYDVIIGREDLLELGIDIKFSTSTIEWPRMNAVIPIKSKDATRFMEFFVGESSSVDEDTERLSRILDAKYSKTDLPQYVEEQSYLTEKERKSLLKLLQQHEPLFDGTLGQWKGDPYHIQLKEDAEPYHGRPYSVPKAYERTLKLELERLVDIGVLKRVNRSEWAFPSFIIPKKDNTVRFINDL